MILSFEPRHHSVLARRTGKTRNSRDKSFAEGVTARDAILISGGARIALPVWVLHAGSSDQTWSAWRRETLPENAKQEIRTRSACVSLAGRSIYW